ncbi:sigma-70 family RNA polymerase sigma factor [Oscillatoria sp. CS-180]|uniref:RNA polymerase sigma factor n=1 Tax=Oscillatoria sp. CS-180 TaxID=3021720 RepID=UPI00232AFA69|nr:sigma-70 family RNA polymerase sigma factor [Oscillatoria sp. CS-180]MDB9525806.1 sigma-70 family RNA polymerase sigma factor [Oscillatoria sp. CS-180]
MQIPSFPECNHTIVQQLGHLSDRELLHHFKAEPEAGRYFTAIFCRYSPVVFSLISHSARSPVQAEYLFALTWRHILNELSGLDLPAEQSTNSEEGASERSLSLQSWLINVTALCINQANLPEVEDIHYSLAQASPPLWCYVERALDRLIPLERLILVMAQTFRWSNTRIAAYLQAEGERIPSAEITARLRQAAKNLEAALPDDIQAIYVGTLPEGEADDPLSGLVASVPVSEGPDE